MSGLLAAESATRQSNALGGVRLTNDWEESRPRESRCRESAGDAGTLRFGGLHATVQGQTRQRRASWVKGEEGQNGTADTGSEQSSEMEERRRAQADRRTGATFTLPDGRGRRGHRRRGAKPLWDSATRRRRRPLPEGLCPSAARLVSNAVAYQLVPTRPLRNSAPSVPPALSPLRQLPRLMSVLPAHLLA